MADKKAAADQGPELETLLKTLTSQPGVEGFLVYNHDGIPIRWTPSAFVKPGAPPSTNPIPPFVVHHAAVAHDLTAKTRTVCKRLFPEAGEGDVALLRLHTKTNEILLAPGEDAQLLVLQRAHSAATLPLTKLAEAAQVAAAEEARKAGGDKKK